MASFAEPLDSLYGGREECLVERRHFRIEFPSRLADSVPAIPWTESSHRYDGCLKQRWSTDDKYGRSKRLFDKLDVAWLAIDQSNDCRRIDNHPLGPKLAVTEDIFALGFGHGFAKMLRRNLWPNFGLEVLD